MPCKAAPQTESIKWQCSALPPEVWINIFSYHADPAHLWTVCRCVSSTLRACAEHAFAEHFLRYVHIDFQLEKYNLGGKSKRPEIPVSFDRLGKRSEKQVAWFNDKRLRSEVCDGNGKKAQDQLDKILRRWEENVHGWRPEMPNYTINICGLVNDTALPGLQISVEERAIQFEWKKMLQLFYREHDRLLAQKKTWQIQTAKQIATNNGRLSKGEKLMPADYPQPWSLVEPEARKQVRRARLKEHYIGREQMLWAIDSLEHFEQYGAASGHARALKLDPDLPGAGLGQKWFGSLNLVQELYLDEWSCMHRIDTKIDHLRTGT
jgi:hypothetical protein